MVGLLHRPSRREAAAFRKAPAGLRGSSVNERVRVRLRLGAEELRQRGRVRIDSQRFCGLICSHERGYSRRRLSERSLT
jgi:hypothetical protein